MNAIPKREQESVTAELAGIWKQPTKEQALTELAAFRGGKGAPKFDKQQ